LRIRESGDGFRAEQLQRVGVAIDRMAAPVEAERLLLEGQLLGLGPRRGFRRFPSGWIPEFRARS